MENKVKLSSIPKTIESLYIDYTKSMFYVNRRYQRKLVWGLEDKRLLIDTILKSYPLPAILLLEDENGNYEILDGLQRLNSIFGYIENKYDYNSNFFDTSSTSYTSGRVTEKKKKLLTNDESRSILGYELSILILSGVSDYDVIDTIFKRINSAGRALSKQELRQAGSLSIFSEKVNEISSYIRGDALIEKKILLEKMGKISLNIDSMSEGINISEQFFVKNIILTKQNILDSEDEYLIAQLLGYILLDDKVEVSNNSCDWLYGIDSGERGSTKKTENIEKNILEKLDLLKSKNIDIKNNFIYIYDILNNFFTGESGKKFQSLFKERNRALKEFYVFFLAIYEIIFNNGHEIQKKIRESVNFSEFEEKIKLIKDVLVFAEGGVQSVKKTKENIDKIKVILDPLFESPGEKIGILSNDIENILRYSNIEGSFYDFKIGICNLKGDLNIEKTLNKISRTIIAISNSLSKSKDYIEKYGYIIIGIGDSLDSSNKIKEEFNLDYEIFSNKAIFGIDKDLKLLNKTEDEYFSIVNNKIKDYLSNYNINIFIDLLIESRKIKGKSCFIIKIPSVLKYGKAILQKGEKIMLLLREGTSVNEINDVETFLEFNKKIIKLSENA